MESEQEASSSNSSNSTRRTWKYDIFLSFMSKDTLKGFTNYLYQALNGRGFSVFRDDEEREREVISEEMRQAIEASRFAIVVLSKNYASSSWCLDELQHILYSRDNMCQQVLPLFYDVVSSDVGSEIGSFAEAFAKHKETFQQDQLKVQIWRDSLTKVANLSGFDSSQYRYESELIENVVEHLWDQFLSELPPVSGSDAVIGIDQGGDEMPALLELDGFRFTGHIPILYGPVWCETLRDRDWDWVKHWSNYIVWYERLRIIEIGSIMKVGLLQSHLPPWYCVFKPGIANFIDKNIPDYNNFPTEIPSINFNLNKSIYTSPYNHSALCLPSNMER